MSVRDIIMAAGGATATSSATYVEDVFSTYLYTGTGASQTITNGIDLATKGGLVWLKLRSSGSVNSAGHFLVDTARGRGSNTDTSDTGGNDTVSSTDGITSFNTNGFTLGTDISAKTNYSSGSSGYTSWTFRKQAKFFDVVTYTGTGSARTISHSLGSTPGMIIVKRTDTTSNWQVYHRSLTSAANAIQLNLTAAQASATTVWNSTAPTSSVFSVGTDATVNASGGTYVAYLFAHDAGGFGAAGTDSVVSCGTFTGNTTVNLGWEPQFILIKSTNAVEGWQIFDNMRGWPASGDAKRLYPNTSAAEDATSQIYPNATGFSTSIGSSTYIYLAIRRGPMKTPTDATKVFAPVARTGTGANTEVTSGFTTDAVIEGNRTTTTAGSKFGVWDRLRGTAYSITNTTASEVAAATTIIQANPWDTMTGLKVGTTSTLTNASSNTFINWMFARAPGFFDVVCYTGTGSAGTVSHNLGVAPELWIIKRRNGPTDWQVGGNVFANPTTRYIQLNAVNGVSTVPNIWDTPTATTFGIGTEYPSATAWNASGGTYVAYLFATCPGVSKVFSFTGNGTSQTIDCGFTNGARFVLIKRTDSTGDWWVYDSARGIVSANDPALALNSTAAEVTSADAVDPASTGFIVNQESTCNINVNSATYIGLAIA